jgi:hypothetical protein
VPSGSLGLLALSQRQHQHQRLRINHLAAVVRPLAWVQPSVLLAAVVAVAAVVVVRAAYAACVVSKDLTARNTAAPRSRRSCCRCGASLQMMTITQWKERETER